MITFAEYIERKFSDHWNFLNEEDRSLVIELFREDFHYLIDDNGRVDEQTANSDQVLQDNVKDLMMRLNNGTYIKIKDIYFNSLVSFSRRNSSMVFNDVIEQKVFQYCQKKERAFSEKQQEVLRRIVTGCGFNLQNDNWNNTLNRDWKIHMHYATKFFNILSSLLTRVYKGKSIDETLSEMIDLCNQEFDLSADDGIDILDFLVSDSVAVSSASSTGASASLPLTSTPQTIPTPGTPTLVLRPPTTSATDVSAMQERTVSQFIEDEIIPKLANSCSLTDDQKKCFADNINACFQECNASFDLKKDCITSLQEALLNEMCDVMRVRIKSGGHYDDHGRLCVNESCKECFDNTLKEALGILATCLEEKCLLDEVPKLVHKCEYKSLLLSIQKESQTMG